MHKQKTRSIDSFVLKSIVNNYFQNCFVVKNKFIGSKFEKQRDDIFDYINYITRVDGTLSSTDFCVWMSKNYNRKKDIIINY